MKTIRRYIVIDAYWDAWANIDDETAKIIILDAMADFKGLKDVQVRFVNQGENDEVSQEAS